MSTLIGKTITFLRRSGSYNSKGQWVEGTATQMTLRGTVQPLKGKEIQDLNINRLDIGTMKLYSDTRLNVSKEGSSSTGDLIVYQGYLWQAIQELPYQNNLLSHYKYIIEQYLQEGAIVPSP